MKLERVRERVIDLSSVLVYGDQFKRSFSQSDAPYAVMFSMSSTAYHANQPSPHNTGV